MSSRTLVLFLAALTFFGACKNEEKKAKQTIKLFTELPADSTGITFSNTVVQNMDINLYNFEYLYNGGGVAVGDINNDGLQDIYFTASLAEDKLYLNKGNLKFEDITQKAGIKHSGMKTGVVMADVNNDGFTDIYVCRTGKTEKPELLNDLLYINNGNLTFTESAAGYGLQDKSNTTHATFFDYDLDGDLDLFLVNHRIDYKTATRVRIKQLPGGEIVRIKEAQTPFESHILYRNNGNGFTDVSRQAGINTSSFGLSVSVGDLNNDNYPDLYVANDYIEPDMCFINNQNGTFSDKIETMFHHISQSTMGTDIADFNNDGFVDIMALDMAAEDNFRQKALINVMTYDRYATLEKYGFGRQLGRNMLHLNNGNGTFSDIGELAGISRTDWSWSPLFADFDNDGRKDLFITNGYRYDVTNTDYLKFTLDSLNKNVGLNTKEKLGIYLKNVPTARLSNYMYRNSGGLRFENTSTAWGFETKTYSNGSACADLDNDGDLDLVINNIDMPASVYRNDERQKTKNNFVQIKLAGTVNNKNGIGTRVEITSGKNNTKQMQEYYPSRGFMSSMPQLLHFGLDKDSVINQLTVRWFDGKTQVLEKIKANQVITLNYADAKTETTKSEQQTTNFFTELTDTGIDFIHHENEFIDFKREPLMPHQLSQEGPCIAVGDINQDGLEDFFIGGGGAKNSEPGTGQAGAVYIQQSNSTFRQLKQPALEIDKDFEDVGAIFFDTDNDNDLDLYVVSGSNEYSRDHQLYQDRLYINDGKGLYTRNTAALPQDVISGSCVKAADYDLDGDMDLFVGGKLIPGSYPLSPASVLLRNEKGKFSNATEASLPKHGKLGMINDALWQDLDGDKLPELIVVGEWTPITILKNRNGKFEDATDDYNLQNTNGWWNCITPVDFDNDGDMDFIAGNLGLNSRLKASEKQPLCIYAKDFDNNGSVDAITSWWNNGTEYPLPQKDLLLSQLPSLKKKYVHYNTYANSTLNDLYPEKVLNSAIRLESKVFTSSLIENKGGKFELSALPDEAQLAPLRCVTANDFDGDGKTDLLLSGNSYQTEVETGLYDAFNGLLLKNTGKGFNAVHHFQSGFFAPGDGRAIVQLKLADGSTLVIATFNNGKTRTFLLNSKVKA